MDGRAKFGYSSLKYSLSLILIEFFLIRVYFVIRFCVFSGISNCCFSFTETESLLQLTRQNKEIEMSVLDIRQQRKRIKKEELVANIKIKFGSRR